MTVDDAADAPVEVVLPVIDGVVVRRDEPLNRHTAWRCGGACDVWVVVHAPSALEDALSALRAAGIRLSILGAGTRTIVREGGVSGAVLRLGSGFCWIVAGDDGVSAGAAAPAAAVVGAAIARGLAGFEGLAGSPGTIASAVLHDDGKVSRSVAGVGVWSRGKEKELSVAELHAARDAGRTPLIVSVRLVGDRRDPARVRAKADDALRKAAASQWFTLPNGADPVPLIVRAELSGARLRGAAIPAQSPAMLVALEADAGRDLELLSASAIERVVTVTGAELATRVGFLGRQRAAVEAPPVALHPATMHRKAKRGRGR